MLEGERTGHEIEKELRSAAGRSTDGRSGPMSTEGVRSQATEGSRPELAELRKEVRELREERDILRKAVAIFSEPQR